jgi:hypothetical protein
MLIGGIYLYSVMSQPAEESSADSTQVTLDSDLVQKKPTSIEKPANQTPQESTPGDSSINNAKLEAEHHQEAPANRSITVSKELRLEKEMSLRLKAEEAFNRSLVESTTDTPEFSEPLSDDQPELNNESLPLSLEFEAEATAGTIDSTVSTTH